MSDFTDFRLTEDDTADTEQQFIADSGLNIEDLAERLPSLAGFPAMLAWLKQLPWFLHLGGTPTPAVAQLARDYGDSLGYPGVEAAFFDDQADALEAALSLDLNGAAWETEESARAGLTAELVDLIGEDVVELIMLHVMQEMGQRLEQAAYDAAARQGVADEEFLRAAVGSAVQACHHAVLVGLLAEEDHPFAQKLGIFAAGRWPISLVGQSLLIY